jgi:hypothetical protein
MCQFMFVLQTVTRSLNKKKCDRGCHLMLSRDCHLPLFCLTNPAQESAPGFRERHIQPFHTVGYFY